MAEGFSVTRASREAGSEFGVSGQTVQRWAGALERPLSRNIQEATKARTSRATAARRQYAGADYRAAANAPMWLTELGIDHLTAEIDENDGRLSGDGIQEVNRLHLALGHAIQHEKALIQLGFGLDPADSSMQGGGDSPLNVIDFDELMDQARDTAARMAARQDEL